MKRTLTLGVILTGLCIGLAVLTLLMSGCSSVARALNIVNPTYSLRNIRPHVNVALPLSASTIDFNFDLGVDNPNGVAINLDRVDFDLLVNSNHLLTSTSQQAVHIPSRGYGEAHLQSHVGYKNIRSIFSEVADLIRGNRANYQMQGTAYYNTPAGALHFPVTVFSSAR